jgi:hypothetical protein
MFELAPFSLSLSDILNDKWDQRKSLQFALDAVSFFSQELFYF